MSKRMITLVLILSLLITGCTNFNESTANHNDNSISSKATIESKLYNPDLVKKDIKEFKSSYLCLFFKPSDEKKMNEFSKKCDDIIKSVDKPMTKEEVFFLISKLSVILEDGHAMVLYSDEKYFLPIHLKWIDEGLVVMKSECDLEKGDKILEINGKQLDSILDKFKNIFSTENIYWLRHNASKLITSRYILNYLVSVNSDNSVSIKVEKVNGDIENYNVFLVKNKKTSKNQHTKPYYQKYKNSNTAVFVLPHCTYDNVYKETLNDFFEYVKNNEISKIIFDLRNNIGGDPRVLDEFLKNINIEKFTFTYNIKKNIEHTSSNLYDGDIYIAINNGSFSAAAEFAGAIKYNKVGKVIGEPAGNATIFRGSPKLLELPNTKIKYFVSTTKVTIPSTEYESAVNPDIYLPLTLKNIVDETDVLEEWIKTLNQ